MSFKIVEGSIEDIKQVIELGTSIRSNMEHKEWYSIDLLKYEKILDKLHHGSILMKALDGEKMIAFLIVERYIAPTCELAKEISKEELEVSIEMDNAGVLEAYRGNHLEQKMILEAEKQMKKIDPKIKYSYATVHPDNLASLKSLENIGYQRCKKKYMYGGFIRYIMKKEI